MFEEEVLEALYKGVSQRLRSSNDSRTFYTQSVISLTSNTGLGINGIIDTDIRNKDNGVNYENNSKHDNNSGKKNSSSGGINSGNGSTATNQNLRSESENAEISALKTKAPPGSMDEIGDKILERYSSKEQRRSDSI